MRSDKQSASEVHQDHATAGASQGQADPNDSNIVDLREGRSQDPDPAAPATAEAPLRQPPVEEEHAQPVVPASRDTSAPEQQAAATPARGAGRARARKALRRFLMLAGIAIVVVVSAVWWLRGGRYVTADNAYVRAAKLMVSTDVSGIVSSVAVRQGQRVEMNQILFRLDPRQFQIAVESAKAQLERVKLEVEAAKQDYKRILSDLEVQKAVVARAKASFDRADELVKRRAGSRAAFDQARFTLDAESSKLQSLRWQADVALTKMGGDANAPAERNPAYREAKAKVEEAERQLSRTIVRAPFGGVVTAVESLQPGTFLVAQTAALTSSGAVGLVSTSDIWIEANIKETDLTHVKTGDPVSVHVDAYPGRVWKAKVRSIFPATGSEFSILPAQNASGNWVKVVQRIPVRIAMERKPDDPVLRAGMSVVVSIDTGHKRNMGDLWRLVGFKQDPLPDVSAWIDNNLAAFAGER